MHTGRMLPFVDLALLRPKKGSREDWREKITIKEVGMVEVGHGRTLVLQKNTQISARFSNMRSLQFERAFVQTKTRGILFGPIWK